jgi:hypothetical protein
MKSSHLIGAPSFTRRGFYPEATLTIDRNVSVLVDPSAP